MLILPLSLSHFAISFFEYVAMSSGGVRLRRGGGTRGKNPPWKNRPRSLPPPREGGGGGRRREWGDGSNRLSRRPPSAAAAAARRRRRRRICVTSGARPVWPGGGGLARRRSAGPGVVYSVTGLQPWAPLSSFLFLPSA